MTIMPIAATTPKQYFCPLSDVEMTKPMEHKKTGLRFEEDAIMDWINKKGNQECPITGEPLSANDLVLDVELQLEIQRWREGKLIGIRDRILNRRRVLIEKSSIILVGADDKMISMDEIMERQQVVAQSA